MVWISSTRLNGERFLYGEPSFAPNGLLFLNILLFYGFEALSLECSDPNIEYVFVSDTCPPSLLLSLY